MKKLLIMLCIIVFMFVGSVLSADWENGHPWDLYEIVIEVWGPEGPADLEYTVTIFPDIDNEDDYEIKEFIGGATFRVKLSLQGYFIIVERVEDDNYVVSMKIFGVDNSGKTHKHYGARAAGHHPTIFIGIGSQRDTDAIFKLSEYSRKISMK